jgi:hypothetical protein
MKPILIMLAVALLGWAFFPPLTLAAAIYCVWYILVAEPEEYDRRYLEEGIRQDRKRRGF